MTIGKETKGKERQSERRKNDRASRGATSRHATAKKGERAACALPARAPRRARPLTVVATPSAGGAGKANWGKLGDEVLEDRVDPKDPNYDPESSGSVLHASEETQPASNKKPT